MKKTSAVFLFLLLPALLFAQGRPLTIDDMMKMKRLGGFSVSPDGKSVVFAAGEVHFQENKVVNDLYLLTIGTKAVQRLTENQKSNFSPVFSRDGKSVWFVSTRTGAPQIFKLETETRQTEQVTSFLMGIGGFVLSADESRIAFDSEVYPEETTPEGNLARSEAADASKVKAQVISKLPYRFWTSWKNGMRNHVWIYDREKKTYTDATPGDFDTPPFDLGGSQDYQFSQDGKSLWFVRNPDRQVAWSTNNDVFLADLATGALQNLTEANKANDMNPMPSPDGKFIAWLSMKRPGFEADKIDILVKNRETGEVKNLTAGLDRSVGEAKWSPEEDAFFFTAGNLGYNSLYQVGVSSGSPRLILDKVSTGSFSFAGPGKIVYSASRSNLPYELFLLDSATGKSEQLTFLNREILAGLDLPAPKEIWYEGANGIKNHAFVFLPPAFDPNKKYPLVYYVHGGPQGAWGDSWSYRWNPQVWAAQGFILVAPNPTGSTGYGQKFTDDISGDWGGAVYTDLIKGLDYSIQNFPVDTTRMAAAGASYGGYMMNWFQGHTTRFKTLISHAGVYNLSTMFGTTEEVWFPLWEFRGTPWTNPEMYKKWSPSEYVKNFRTPTLVIHGALDFRVPESQAFEYFTALQYQGVESRFLYFPDEGHWILKPQNSKFWHDTIFSWLKEKL
ncbi:MAG: S9 family peptidase [Bacteroidetes bacterium]|nr:S9 family peptidase [Bacteroidota bacterium]